MEQPVLNEHSQFIYLGASILKAGSFIFFPKNRVRNTRFIFKVSHIFICLDYVGAKV